MFGRRSDGKLVHGLDGITRLMPLFVRTRSGASNLYMFDIEASYFDDFIEKKKLEGFNYCYMDIVIASLVRAFKVRPKLNQFIINNRIYQRNDIDCTMMVKKNLREESEETGISPRFTGYETIDEVKVIIDEEIKKALKQTNGTDNERDFLAKMPMFILKIVVFFIKFFDNHGLLSKNFLRYSPFHASFWVTNLKSIGLDAIFHHLFDFGNCGFFLALGKEKVKPHLNSETNQIEKTKMIEMGITMDERFVDGLYYSRTLRLIKNYFKNLHLLEKPLEEDEIIKLKSNKTKDK
ncbi:MAG: hypothetical protein LBV58_01310 [Acholeplasmatales bacterium]|jgi:hypothetical protein|nr:hypothetical protein [Acholeplasmatales bacterium]